MILLGKAGWVFCIFLFKKNQIYILKIVPLLDAIIIGEKDLLEAINIFGFLPCSQNLHIYCIKE